MDRNILPGRLGFLSFPSLSARRAWIEITNRQAFSRTIQVALRKESVDRNDVLAISAVLELSRSPQGERG